MSVQRNTVEVDGHDSQPRSGGIGKARGANPGNSGESEHRPIRSAFEPRRGGGEGRSSQGAVSPRRGSKARV